MLTNFERNVKQQLFICRENLSHYSFYHQIQITWYIHPAQSPWSSVTLLFFNVLIHFSLGTKNSNTNFNNLCYIRFRFDELLS